jgi:hypothetical protein
MRDGIDVLGNYESTGWTRCSNSETVLGPESFLGVTFGPDVFQITTLDGFTLRPDARLTSTAVTVNGGSANLNHVVTDPVSTLPAGNVAAVSYGVDVKNGGRAFIVGSRIVAAWSTGESIAVRAVGATAVLWLEPNVVRASGQGIAAGVWLENGGLSTVDRSDIEADSREPVGVVHVEGNGSNIRIFGNDIRGTRRGIVVNACMGAGPEIRDNDIQVANRPGDTPGNQVIGLTAGPNCDLRLDGNEIDALSYTPEGVQGINLHGPRATNGLKHRSHAAASASR